MKTTNKTGSLLELKQLRLLYVTIARPVELAGVTLGEATNKRVVNNKQHFSLKKVSLLSTSNTSLLSLLFISFVILCFKSFIMSRNARINAAPKEALKAEEDDDWDTDADFVVRRCFEC